MTLKEAIPELHQMVRECFSRHQFKTFGDALKWWNEAPYETQKQESGSAGMSRFCTDIVWLISLFGPSAQVDHEIIDVKSLSPITAASPELEENPPDITRPSRKRPQRRRRF